MKVITVYNLVEQYKINGSLARRTIQELLKKGTIKVCHRTAHLGIYTASKAHKKAEKEESSKSGKKEGGKKKKGKKKKKDDADE
jgi:ribosomal protein L19E